MVAIGSGTCPHLNSLPGVAGDPHRGSGHSVRAFLLANVLSALIGRPVAFRVDESGVTIGGNPVPFWYRASTRFIPWTQIQQVSIWHRDFPLTIGDRTLFNLGRACYVGLVRSPGAAGPVREGVAGQLREQARLQGAFWYHRGDSASGQHVDAGS